jgi:hypothetical protein
MLYVLVNVAPVFGDEKKLTQRAVTAHKSRLTARATESLLLARCAIGSVALMSKAT